jgi:ATP-dependent Clp protease ATP-binding subunit ClpC
VYVLEPNEEDTLAILQGLAERYERHHHCVYSEEALEAAVKLSHTYIADRFLPDKVRAAAAVTACAARLESWFLRSKCLSRVIMVAALNTVD